MACILKVEGLTKRFGGLIAVNNCTFDLEEHTIVGLIGPNGSGKTTIFNLVMNLLKPDSGRIHYKGMRIDHLKPYVIAKLGVGRTFQDIRLFKSLPVIDNMSTAGMTKRYVDWEDRALQLLELVGLAELRDENAENLSFGQQRLLEFAMALMPEPEFIMLDEPVAGVHPLVVARMTERIRELRQAGKTFLIIEHNIPFVMGICERIIVLNYGEVIADGPPSIVKKDPRVMEAYLGRRAT